MPICLLGSPIDARTQKPIRIAVLSFGAARTSVLTTARIREIFASAREEFALVDSDLASSASRGAGYEGSLNLTVSDARDLGAAIGADFYFVGTADTVRRSPSTGSPYYESYASIFLISARTGRLVFWERPLQRADTPEKATNSLMQTLASDETRHRYQTEIRRTLEEERAQRAEAIASAPQFVEVMSDDNVDNDGQIRARAPRPFRRLKPPYPESAAVAEVEAVVDVLVDIDARGEVSHIEISRWAGYGLDESVVNTVKQMHFFPAMLDGTAIPARVLLRYNFRKPPPESRTR